jgi:hypothetical protein
VPRIRGKYRPAKIFHDSSWTWIAEKIYYNGAWVKIDYWLHSLTVTEEPRGSHYGNAISTTIELSNELWA